LSSDLTVALQVAGKNASRNSVSALGTTLELLMMMMMMINFINVSRPHSLGKSHTNLGTQLIDIKNM